jgi:nuclear pore complex protein Nup155
MSCALFYLLQCGRRTIVVIQVYLQVNQLVRSALQSPDELMHMAVYNWLLSKKLTADLITVHQPSLETYLLRTSELTQSPDIYDLLWKYYEKNMNHAAAAKILYKLAIRPG